MDNKNEKDVHVGIGLLACVVLCTAIIAKRLSARQLIVHRILEIVSIYVCTCTCMYVHVSVTQLHIFRATRKCACTCTCTSVTLGNVTETASRGAYDGLLPLQASCM